MDIKNKATDFGKTLGGSNKPFSICDSRFFQYLI